MDRDISAGNLGGECGLHHRPRALDIGAYDRVGVARPETIIGGSVRDVAHPGHGARDCIVVADVTLNAFDFEPGEIAARARGANERPDRISCGQKGADNRRSDEPGRPRHQHPTDLGHQRLGITHPSIRARRIVEPAAGASLDCSERLNVVPGPSAGVASMIVRPP